jgi:rhodanese-related sulfurtransferase
LRTIAAHDLKPTLTDGEEIAFIDVREQGQYGEGHAFFAVNLPYSGLELDAPALLPRRAVRCVLIDDGDGVAAKAARRLEALGYSQVTVLEGGAPAWKAAGFALFKGVNVPSKAFGELVEHEMGTPSISAEELRSALERDEPLAILDGRSAPEFRKMTIPGARSCPNAELGYRLGRMVPDAHTRIVVNCAGRTRSIIGAQTLRTLGVANEVLALRNGTQGWQLAGLDLVHGAEPGDLPGLSAAERDATRATAERLVAGAQLPTTDEATLAEWRQRDDRTVYLLDVRTGEEYARTHVPGALHAPGGQLVQATDRWIGVRNARIVLSDDTLLRAATTAMWLLGMGHQVWVLRADASAVTPAPAPAPSTSAPAALATIDADAVPARVAAGTVLLDLSPSTAYRAAHIDGARWATRARLDRLGLRGSESVLLAGPADSASLAALDLGELGVRRIEHVAGGPDDWRQAGLDLVSTPAIPGDAECIDYLFFVHDRHDGNLDAARRYLEWEVGLLEQMDAQERSVLEPRLVDRAAAGSQ